MAAVGLDLDGEEVETLLAPFAEDGSQQLSFEQFHEAIVDIAAGAGAAVDGGSFLSAFFAPKHRKILADNPVLRQAQIAWEKKMRTAIDDAVSDAEIIDTLSKKVFAKKVRDAIRIPMATLS